MPRPPWASATSRVRSRRGRSRTSSRCGVTCCATRACCNPSMLSSSGVVAYADLMAYFILRVLVAALGLWLATEWVGGIQVSTATTLILAALLLGLVNAIVRPIVVLL